jgi:hypothetical protein
MPALERALAPAAQRRKPTHFFQADPEMTQPCSQSCRWDCVKRLFKYASSVRRRCSVRGERLGSLAGAVADQSVRFGRALSLFGQLHLDQQRSESRVAAQIPEDRIYLEPGHGCIVLSVGTVKPFEGGIGFIAIRVRPGDVIG